MIQRIRQFLRGLGSMPEHLRRGKLGEQAAGATLKGGGMKILARNYRAGKGELDLVCRDGDCLVFVEVKTRSSEEWGSPSTAVDKEKRRLLSEAALFYLKRLKNPRVSFRFDVVEVVLSKGEVEKIRHLPNAFQLSRPLDYR